jgi:GDP-4-dehydro-6-deoxy-D-mannose reductase
MSILVTGMSGFVGSHFAQQMAAVDLTEHGSRVDLRDLDRVRRAVHETAPHAVLHLAAQSWVPASVEDPRQTYEINFFGTLNLLLALRDAGFNGTMLYVGSADVYGAVPETQLPIVEDCSAKPLNPYAVSKVAAEALCYQWSRSAPFKIVVARPFNHIGPRQSAHFAVSDFARQIVACRNGKAPPSLFVGDIDTTRDFTDVRDIVRAYAALLKSGRNGESYNVCSGVERSMREIIAALCNVCGVKMEIQVAADRLRATEQRRMCGSFIKLQADTGWTPSIPFDRTLRDIVHYWDKEDGT